MSKQSIELKGVRVHNLKNIDLNIRLNQFVVITGVSGSGKSSLAFDTLYAEGQRRYVESLSSYARQFLGQMEKPNVEKIEGLSPAISIDQKSTNRNPRSTVGTVTEIYDYFRLLYARIGIPHCPKCGREIRRQTVDQIVDQIAALPQAPRVQLLAPVIRARKGEHQKVFDDARRGGYARVRVDGSLYELTEENCLRITYDVVSDADTILNLTNHCYFNLDGHGAGPITDHELQLFSHAYTPADAESIPNGDILRVEGTPMDFRTPHEVGERINDNFEQLIFGKGYDHTYILNKEDNELSYCARCSSPKTGIVMETYTTQPGVQLYTGNWMTGNFEGKNGQRYPERAALCLETQHFPDSPNKPEYPTTELRPGEVFQSTTIYKFSVE